MTDLGDLFNTSMEMWYANKQLKIQGSPQSIRRHTKIACFQERNDFLLYWSYLVDTAIYC